MADKQPDTQTVIRVKDVHKDFHLPHEKSNSLKSMIVNVFKKKDKEVETQHALRGVSFEIKKGEFFGIVGRNGSGKSTLLKIIAEIYRPTSGKVTTYGKLVPFIELGVGFNPELTGRENVYLNGALLGFSRDEVDEKYDEIVRFAELEDFMDQKLKNYSSGMQVRLAFSVAIQAEGDILVLDEVLAVGDEAFQRKCLSYFAELKKKKKTVILVTHSMDSVQRFCTKALMIENGKIVLIGNPAIVAQKYIESNNEAARESAIDTKRETKSYSKFVDVEVNCMHNETTDKIEIETTIKQKIPMDDPVIAILINSESGEQIYRWSSDNKVSKDLDFTDDTIIKLKLDNIFPVGTFSINIRVLKRDRTEDYATLFNVASFEIENNSLDRWDIHWKPKEEYHISNNRTRGVGEE